MGAALGIGAAPGHYRGESRHQRHSLCGLGRADGRSDRRGLRFRGRDRSLHAACLHVELHASRGRRGATDGSDADGNVGSRWRNRTWCGRTAADALLWRRANTESSPRHRLASRASPLRISAADQLARAAVDGVAAGLAYCLAALRRLAIDEPEIVLVGGGSAHATWQQAIADATQLPVTVRGGREHVALGAAMQAASVVTGVPVIEISDRWKPDVDRLFRSRARSLRTGSDWKSVKR